MLHALAEGDAFAIKSRVIDALTNTALVHNDYYREQEIREKIARLIATFPQSRPPRVGAAAVGPLSWLEQIRATGRVSDLGFKGWHPARPAEPSKANKVAGELKHA
jgi:hypothetical protein